MKRLTTCTAHVCMIHSHLIRIFCHLRISIIHLSGLVCLSQLSEKPMILSRKMLAHLNLPSRSLEHPHHQNHLSDRVSIGSSLLLSFISAIPEMTLALSKRRMTVMVLTESHRQPAKGATSLSFFLSWGNSVVISHGMDAQIAIAGVLVMPIRGSSFLSRGLVCTTKGKYSTNSMPRFLQLQSSFRSQLVVQLLKPLSRCSEARYEEGRDQPS